MSLNNSAGLYGSNRAAPSLPQTVEFDPTTTNVPTNDFFDNRTISLSSQANLTMQRSTRLSVSIGGDGFITRRRSSALYGVTGIGAHGDFQYRLTRRSTSVRYTSTCTILSRGFSAAPIPTSAGPIPWPSRVRCSFRQSPA